MSEAQLVNASFLFFACGWANFVEWSEWGKPCRQLAVPRMSVLDGEWKSVGRVTCFR